MPCWPPPATTLPSSCAGWRGFCAPSSGRSFPRPCRSKSAENDRLPVLHGRLLSEENTKSDYKRRDDILYMEKSAPYIRSYEKIKTDFVARKKPVSNVLEIGIFGGGSAPFLHRLFDAH